MTPDLDGLRERVAEVIYDKHPDCAWTGPWADDLADAVMAEVGPVIEQARADLLSTLDEAHTQIERLRAALAARGRCQVTVSLRFAWYDLWVGAYVDRARRRLYVCPLPCVLLTFAVRDGAK